MPIHTFQPSAYSNPASGEAPPQGNKADWSSIIGSTVGAGAGIFSSYQQSRDIKRQAEAAALMAESQAIQAEAQARAAAASSQSMSTTAMYVAGALVVSAFIGGAVYLGAKAMGAD